MADSDRPRGHDMKVKVDTFILIDVTYASVKGFLYSLQGQDGTL